jgi:hypothetical protein
MSTQPAQPQIELRLATVSRGPTEQLRLVWREHNGSPFVDVRIWSRDARGRFWPDPRRGLSVRPRELKAVAEAIEKARELANDRRAGWTPLPAEGAGR